jgi:hypothetical protein
MLPAEVNGLIQKAWDALEQTEKEAYVTKVCPAIMMGSSGVQMVTGLLPRADWQHSL